MSCDKRGENRIPPPPYKVPNLHPRNYYKTDQLKESENSERNVQTRNEAEKDPYPWLDSDDPQKIYVRWLDS